MQVTSNKAGSVVMPLIAETIPSEVVMQQPAAGVPPTKLTDPYWLWYQKNELALPTPNARIPLVLELATDTADEIKRAIKELRKLDAIIPKVYEAEPVCKYVAAHVAHARMSEFVKSAFVKRYELGVPIDNPERMVSIDPFYEFQEQAAQQTYDSQGTLPQANKPVVAFIDYGCAFAHTKFCTHPEDGAPARTRVFAIWNQQGPDAPQVPSAPRLDWRRPNDFGYGSEVFREDGNTGVAKLGLNSFINKFTRSGASLDERDCYAAARYAPIQRRFTHGTHIMDVATGYPDPLAPEGESGMLHDADIIFVQLQRFVADRQTAGLLRAHVLDAIRYILARAGKQDVVINLSYGAYAGPHDGGTILEQAMDELIDRWKKEHQKQLNIVIAAGNTYPGFDPRPDHKASDAYPRFIHARVPIQAGKKQQLTWVNMADDPSDSFVELWLRQSAKVNLKVKPPLELPEKEVALGNEIIWTKQKKPKEEQIVAAVFYKQAVCQSADGTMILLAAGPTKHTPERLAAPYGEWVIEIENIGSDEITVDAWCERDDPVFGGTGIQRQHYFSTFGCSEQTLNTIAHGQKTIVVGGYRLNDNFVAPYSSTGPYRDQALIRQPDRPNVLAPCEESAALRGIRAAAVYGQDTVRLSGTSVAAARITRFIIENQFRWDPLKLVLPNPTLGPDGHPDKSRLRVKR